MTLTHTHWQGDGILGRLNDADGYQMAVTLEHAFRQEDGTFRPKLPAGDYVCQRGTHQLEHGAPFETFEITGVPGHTGILFHQGNFNKDSDGCVLLGRVLSHNADGAMVTESEHTFARFMLDLAGVDSFPLTVRDADLSTATGQDI